MQLGNRYFDEDAMLPGTTDSLVSSNYESVEAMQNEASQVVPEGGSIGTSMVTWINTPHFYKTGRIIALYVGSDQTILSLLEKVLAPQFAGR
jgi:hypothetical protein